MEADSLGTVVRAYEEFLSGRVVHTAGRIFAAFLVVDVVQSTARQRRSGDAAWRLMRQEFETEAARWSSASAGVSYSSSTTGLLARFALAGEALHVARHLGDVACGQGVEIRTGVHAGEAEDLGADVSGICVNIAVRVARRAGAGEILATATVRDLVEGSALRFADAGEAELKGVGRRRLLQI